MNNAAAFEGGDALSKRDAWRRILDVNILGVLNGVQCIGHKMIERGKPGLHRQHRLKTRYYFATGKYRLQRK